MVLDQRESEAFHVVEMTIERRGRNAGNLGDFAQAERVEAAARRQLDRRGVHKSLPCLGFLLFPRNLQHYVPVRRIAGYVNSAIAS